MSGLMRTVNDNINGWEIASHEFSTNASVYYCILQVGWSVGWLTVNLQHKRAEYCKSGYFCACNFSRFSDFWHFRLFLNSRFSAILHRPTHKINTFAKINVIRKFPLLQYLNKHYQSWYGGTTPPTKKSMHYQSWFRGTTPLTKNSMFCALSKLSTPLWKNNICIS